MEVPLDELLEQRRQRDMHEVSPAESHYSL